MKVFKTTKFDITYQDYKYKFDKNLSINFELYRCYLVEKFKTKFLNKLKHLEINTTLKLTLLFYLITNDNNNNNDVVITNDFKYDKEYFDEILIDMDDELKNKIYKLIKNKFIKYHDKLEKFKSKIKKEKHAKIKLLYDVYELFINKHSDNKIKNRVYRNKFYINESKFINLKKTFNVTNNNIYTADLSQQDEQKFLDLLFMICIRLKTLSGGTVQSSIFPSLKKILKEKLNVKIELCGSALNTSMNKYGCIYYDIEKYFGGMGSFFDMEIKEGYYEINPPFTKYFVIKMFKKIFSDLEIAENNKKQLLFCVFLPSYQYINLLSKNKFLLNSIQVDTKYFPYLLYDFSSNSTEKKSIINTYIFIFATSYINESVKRNVLNFKFILNKWKKLQ